MFRSFSQNLKIFFTSPFLVLLLLTFFSKNLSANAAEGFDFAPVFKLEFDDFSRPNWYALGPIFEHSFFSQPEDENFLLTMPRPFFSYFSKNAGKRTGYDLFWPLAMRRNSDLGHYQYALLFVNTKLVDQKQEPVRERWWLLPVFFYGYDKQHGGHLGVFPIFGSAGNIIGYDRISWALFPLYLSTQKEETSSTTLLWPVLSFTKGPRVNKWRVFPAYGVRHTPDETRRFILWPFIHTISQKDEEHDPVGSGTFVLPVAGYYSTRPAADVPSMRMWTVLWPFFSGRHHESALRLHLPWPFFQYEKTSQPQNGSDKLYLWPLFGRRSRPSNEYRFLAWPIIQTWDEQYGKERQLRRWILPFYWNTQIMTENKTAASLYHIWPIFRYMRKDDHVYAWSLAPWPIPEGDGISRNYSPLFRFFTYASHHETSRHQLFWGLWQYKTGPEHREASLFPLFDYKKSKNAQRWSIFKGLAGRETQAETGQSTMRVLWFFKF